ncbi:hypothetical protein [Actinophytocola oryzae]|uniref:Uncharacterized protein n=1 Tax=Actinophytocola oryzae TaxID=502181 RepID=A0A4R7W2D7_9PSEU|nr:hypothetical protein [Actinophytocola oryzae]TDV56275.1 hypothetical protein CLV71_102341 [Actinophytocola oryzae]
MDKEPDQIAAWKDVEARDEETDDHPAGRMSLPGRLSAASRAAILAGYMGVSAAGAVTNMVPTIPSSFCCGWLC